MKKIELSLRMKAVADMVVPGGCVADIGCDHAFVSIYLIESRSAERIIASDLRTGPVDIARQNVCARGLETVIDVRMGDGLDVIMPGEADTIILAGMGGMLINKILQQGVKTVRLAKQLVLQPQSDLAQVRKQIRQMGGKIHREEMVVDMDKYYTILDVRMQESYEPDVKMQEPSDAKVEDAGQEVFDRYGKDLLLRRHPVLYTYLQKEADSYNKVLQLLRGQQTEKAKQRMEELICAQQYVEAALKFYEA